MSLLQLCRPPSNEICGSEDRFWCWQEISGFGNVQWERRVNTMCGKVWTTAHGFARSDPFSPEYCVMDNIPLVCFSICAFYQSFSHIVVFPLYDSVGFT